MLTDEEREEVFLALYDVLDTPTIQDRIYPLIAARVRAARAQERQQVIDELHGFLPEWNYPAHVIAAISLELKDRANHIESSQNG